MEPAQAGTFRDWLIAFNFFGWKRLGDGGHSRIRTYDFHRVKVALYR